MNETLLEQLIERVISRLSGFDFILSYDINEADKSKFSSLIKIIEENGGVKIHRSLYGFNEYVITANDLSSKIKALAESVNNDTSIKIIKFNKKFIFISIFN